MFVIMVDIIVIIYMIVKMIINDTGDHGGKRCDHRIKR